MLAPENKTIHERPLIFVTSEKGGVRKTFTALAIVDYLTLAGVPARIFQVDSQGRLCSAFNGVTTINLPAVDEFRTNELADALALAPLDNAILEDLNVAVVVDVGANLDARVATFAVSAGWDSEATEAGRDIVIVTPFLLDSDSILLAGRTARRMAIAFPRARFVPVACLSEAKFNGFPSAAMKQTFEDGFGKVANVESLMFHPPIYTSALRLVEACGSTPQRFIDLDPRSLEPIVGMPRAAIRQAQGDLARYVVELREGLQCALPFRGQFH
jgi:hypothetical protein